MQLQTCALMKASTEAGGMSASAVEYSASWGHRGADAASLSSCGSEALASNSVLPLLWFKVCAEMRREALPSASSAARSKGTKATGSSVDLLPIEGSDLIPQAAHNCTKYTPATLKGATCVVCSPIRTVDEH